MKTTIDLLVETRGYSGQGGGCEAAYWRFEDCIIESVYQTSRQIFGAAAVFQNEFKVDLVNRRWPLPVSHILKFDIRQ